MISLVPFVHLRRDKVLLIFVGQKLKGPCMKENISKKHPARPQAHGANSNMV